ncbi:MAG: hypothetical protein WEC75_04240 [Dehalococcoidia bacterium]
MEFGDRVAIVTGPGLASGGRRRACWRPRGVRVVVADIDAEEGRETVWLIGAGGGEAAFVRTDVGTEAPVRRMVACGCPDRVDTPVTQRTRAELSPKEWRAIAPPRMAPPEEIAAGMPRLARDEKLAGRVMLCADGKQILIPPPKARATE